MKPLEFKLPQVHYDILMSDAKYKVLAIGRRGGKTNLIVPAVYKHLSKPFHNVKTKQPLRHQIGYYSPTLKQGIDNFWDRALEGFDPILKHVDKVYRKLTFSNGGVFQFFGTDVSPRTLRGSYRTLVIRDEAAFQDDEVCKSVLMPMLADTQGELLDLSSTNGWNLFYDHFQYGQDENLPDWQSWQYESWEGGYITREYQESQRPLCSVEQYDAEWRGKFVGATGRVYYAYIKENNITNIIPQNDSALHWGWDFNQIPCCHSVLSHLGDQSLFVFDEICTGDTPQIMKSFMEKYPPGFFPKICLYGDANGHRTTTGISDYDIMKEMLYTNGYGEAEVRVYAGNPSVRNRTNHVNRLLLSASGSINLLIDPSCYRLIRDLEKVVRSGKTGQIDKTGNPELSHASDALGYLAMVAIPPIYEYL